MKNRFRRSRTVRIANQDGRLVIHGMGNWYHLWRDPYHLLLTVPWIGFIGIVSVAYLLLNTVFALAYLVGGDCLEGARPGSFTDAFFFSVQTLASIGYGAIHPKNFYANCVVTLEAIASLLLMAVVTGLAFARFSRPIAKVLFSKFIIITTHNRQQTLMFRVANERHNFILESTAQVYLIMDEITAEGDFMRRIQELKLLRHRTPSLILTWTIAHQIDADSPLYGLTTLDLQHRHAAISVLIDGVDETVAYKITARHSYNTAEIIFDRQFEDIIHKAENGDRYFDYSRFHQLRSIEEIEERNVDLL
ncbi:ion channel [Chamaesiphon minutus]|uniref:Inward rectifier potassium channel n=1 Tax=Chamaesiphon minutus (strain ATCC 27169 / PCC 6605) TaxID=1173020 RepID=K9UGP0_CHAP6|nr:ion channel [Chamaesiphon minutus]AFY94000.1 Inward rectifier potassium channel [Chamaesiphon minutus PCC 6605]